jgi:hypothetical protein
MDGITEQQQLTETENSDSKMDMEQNVKYESSTDHDGQISLTSNVAYSKSVRQLEENNHENEYDCIIYTSGIIFSH